MFTIKNNSLEELKTIFKRVIQYLTNIDFTSGQSNKSIIGIDDLSKDGLIENNVKLRSKKKDGQPIPLAYFNLSVPILMEMNIITVVAVQKKEKGRFKVRV